MSLPDKLKPGICNGLIFFRFAISELLVDKKMNL